MGVMTAIALPKKLAVSMGIELTFLPAIFQRLWEEQKIQPNAEGWEMTVRNGYSHMLKAVLHKRGIRVYTCGTDPDCVEVPTVPRVTANSLMKDVRQIYNAARSVDLIPRAGYIAGGGGAHLHTGIPNSVDEAMYRKLAQVWACENPWMAWAFSDKTDQYNAHPIAREVLLNNENTVDRLHEKLADCAQMIKEYGAAVQEQEKRLHLPHVWQDSWDRRGVSSNIRNYITDMLRYKASMRETLRQIEALKYLPQDTTSIHAIKPKGGKGIFLSSRPNTMEFRCFLMTEHTTGMRKHIALADAIVRKITKEAANAPQAIPRDFGFSKMELFRMKYSEAKHGFNNMLEELGLPPDAYRSQRVNIALRMRYARRNR